MTIASYYFHHPRELIDQNNDDGGRFAGEIEAEESYFGGKCKGKRGPGAAGKPVSGLLKRDTRVTRDERGRCRLCGARHKPDSVVCMDSPGRQ